MSSSSSSFKTNKFPSSNDVTSSSSSSTTTPSNSNSNNKQEDGVMEKNKTLPTMKKLCYLCKEWKNADTDFDLYKICKFCSIVFKKRCGLCKLEFRPNMFTNRAKGPTGLSNVCKNCEQIKRRDTKRKNIEKLIKSVQQEAVTSAIEETNIYDHSTAGEEEEEEEQKEEKLSATSLHTNESISFVEETKKTNNSNNGKVDKLEESRKRDELIELNIKRGTHLEYSLREEDFETVKVNNLDYFDSKRVANILLMNYNPSVLLTITINDLFIHYDGELNDPYQCRLCNKWTAFQHSLIHNRLFVIDKYHYCHACAILLVFGGKTFSHSDGEKEALTKLETIYESSHVLKGKQNDNKKYDRISIVGGNLALLLKRKDFELLLEKLTEKEKEWMQFKSIMETMNKKSSSDVWIHISLLNFVDRVLVQFERCWGDSKK